MKPLWQILRVVAGLLAVAFHVALYSAVLTASVIVAVRAFTFFTGEPR